MPREYTIEAEQINNWLALGPRVPLPFLDQPLMRLVWSDDMHELRRGTFTDFDVHGNPIRTYTKLETVLKYSYIKERWILEKWAPPEHVLNPELPESHKGSYEPVYVFEDFRGNSLLLNLKVAQMVARNSLLGKSRSLRKSEIAERHEQKEKQLDKRDWDILNDESALVSQLHDGSAIILPGKEIK
jgi:hypothetical protein